MSKIIRIEVVGLVNNQGIRVKSICIPKNRININKWFDNFIPNNINIEWNT